MSNKEIVRFVAAETPNLEFHDGGLRPAVGVHCVQVVRSNREHPEEADGLGNTYNHAPNLTYWKKRFYLAYLSNPVSEHTGSGQTFLCVSESAGNWSKPTSLFPPYPLDLSLDNGPGAELFEEGACACMHQRMNFFIAKDGRLLAVGYYGLAPSIEIMPCRGYGVGRVVREIYEDGTFGPIYFVLYCQWTGYRRETCLYPHFTQSTDAGFVRACEEMLNDPLTTMQWWEENRDAAEDLFPLRGGGEAFNWYQRTDGQIVGLWKRSKAALSPDGGRTWSDVQICPSLVMSGGKVWGERISDGRFVLAYNPNTDSTHRWPLAVVTGDDGETFSNMLCVHGEVPPMRYYGLWKDYGPQYVRGLEAGAVSPDGALYLTYSVNKEDIWVARVPVPIKQTVRTPVQDCFAQYAPSPWVEAWNTYSGCWCSVSLERRIDQDASPTVLRLSSKDRYGQAIAERVFPESTHVSIQTRIFPQQNDNARLEIDLKDGDGRCVFRVILHEDGQVYAKHGNAVSHIGLIRQDWMTFYWDADCRSKTVSFHVDNAEPLRFRFFNNAQTLERIRFRTGERRHRPYLDEEPTPGDLPFSGEPLEFPSIFDLDGLTVDSIVPT